MPNATILAALSVVLAIEDSLVTAKRAKVSEPKAQQIKFDVNQFFCI